MRLRRENLLLIFASLGVSLLIWLQAQQQSEPARQREFTVPLQLLNVPDQLIVIRAPRQVSVVVTGTAQDLDRMDPNSFQAMIDLRKGTVGTRAYPVQLTAPARLATGASLKRGSETLALAAVVRDRRPVVIETRGNLPDDLQYGASSIDPEYVWIVGPQAYLVAVQRVRALLDISQVRPGNEYSVALELLGKRGQPVPFVRAEPPTAIVRPGLIPAPSVRNVLIVPVWSGQPAFGYEVKGYELRPNQVRLTGDGAILGKLVMLRTTPIDLSGLKADATIAVGLELPKGVRSPVSRVRAVLRVGPVPAPQPQP